MAGTADAVDVARFDNKWLDAIAWGTRWASGTPVTHVSVCIAGQGAAERVPDGMGGSIRAYRAAPEEVAAIRAAMASFEAVCGLRFDEVASDEEADVVWAMVDRVDAGGRRILGWAFPPGEGLVRNEAQSPVAINRDGYVVPDHEGLRRGGYDFTTLIHEFGHAVGLAHPHDRGGDSSIFPGVSGPWDLGRDGMNQGVHTMMSYNSGWATGRDGPSPDDRWGYEAAPMAFDVAALQALYGANMAHNAGDDLYRLPDADGPGSFYACLWDAGGTDRIVGSADHANIIDLRAATLGDGPGAGGWVSHARGVHGGRTIAFGVLIEQAQGGGRADSLRGNEGANLLLGLANDDALRGGQGGDRLLGGGGDDRLLGGTGDDVLVGGGGRDRLSGQGGSDVFVFHAPGDSGTGERADIVAGFAAGRDLIDLAALDANGAGRGNGAFRLDAGGSLMRGEIRQAVQDGDLVLGLNLDSDAEVEMAIRLVGIRAPLAESDFAL